MENIFSYNIIYCGHTKKIKYQQQILFNFF